MENDTSFIWLSDVHPLSGLAAVLEDNGTSCWLYLHKKVNGPILKSLFVYSPISLTEYKANTERESAPILTTSYASAHAVITDRIANDFHFKWRNDGLALAIVFRGDVIAATSLDEKYGSSRAISKAGPFGDPLITENYTWLSGDDTKN